MMNLNSFRAATLGCAIVVLGPTLAQPVPVPSNEDLQVFDESTSFVDLLANKAEATRSPASIEPLARVIAVRRELGMSAGESDRAPQDIILNGGTNSGLSEGMKLAVVRKIPVLDPYRENAQSELEVEFANVKIIHVQKDVAIARVEKIDAIDDGLFLGTRGVLIGDFITRGKR